MKIFIICPVRKIAEKEKRYISDYVSDLEKAGHVVHLPFRDTCQEDETGGYMICKANRDAIFTSDEVHIYYSGNSSGTLFDLGVAFAANKKLKIINMTVFEKCDEMQLAKSFPLMMKYWSER